MPVRRFRSIAKATTLEILSEPLSLLLCLSAMLLSTLAPTFHYHQFGEPTRMARDAGFSSLLLFGLVFAVVGTVRTFRRELEGGTAALALAHSISRAGFFLAKVTGACAAYLVFVLVVAFTSCVVVNGAAIGGVQAQHDCDIARLHGPSVALAMAAVILPLAAAGALNRFRRWRFTLTAMGLALACATLFLAYRPDFALWARLLPVAALAAEPAFVFLALAAALSVRGRTTVIAGGVAALGVVSLPAIGNYYLADALAKGGSLSAGYFWGATAAILPVFVALLLLGVRLFRDRDVG